jgi:hypothetical protein
LRAKIQSWHDANEQGDMPTEEAKAFCAGARAAEGTILIEIDSMLRTAQPPQELEGREIRNKAIRECAAIADECTERIYGPYGEQHEQPEAAEQIAKQIRELLED